MHPLIYNLPKNTQLELIFFEEYVKPNGFLSWQVEEHALFYYYIHASQVYKKFFIDTPIVYEDEKDPEYNFEQLFKSVAALYNVQPEHMANAWEIIDKQCDLLNLIKLPKDNKFRFSSIIMIKKIQ